MPVDKMFEVHMLNEQGRKNAEILAASFDCLLSVLKTKCPEGREFALAKTRLEESCFYAKKAMAAQPENQTT